MICHCHFGLFSGWVNEVNGLFVSLSPVCLLHFSASVHQANFLQCFDFLFNGFPFAFTGICKMGEKLGLEVTDCHYWWIWQYISAWNHNTLPVYVTRWQKVNAYLAGKKTLKITISDSSSAHSLSPHQLMAELNFFYAFKWQISYIPSSLFYVWHNFCCYSCRLCTYLLLLFTPCVT